MVKEVGKADLRPLELFAKSSSPPKPAPNGGNTSIGREVGKVDSPTSWTRDLEIT